MVLAAFAHPADAVAWSLRLVQAMPLQVGALGGGWGRSLALQLGSLVAPSFGQMLPDMNGDGGGTLTPCIECFGMHVSV